MNGLPDVVIRAATSTDVNDVAICVDAAYRPYIARMGKPPGPMLDDYHQIIRDHQVLVADVGQIVGVAVIIKTPVSVMLDNVAVSPNYQGQGIGKRLIVSAQREALNAGAETLTLYTHILMTENIAMYKTLGFTETQRKTVNGFDRVYFEKSLARNNDHLV